MNNILTQNKLVKNLRAYPVLRKRWRGYIRGVRALPEGFTEDKLFHDYLRVRRSNPEKRVSMSEYMIFGFYGLTTAQQKQYLTDVEATLLMRPYNSIAEPYLKSKVTFLKNFTQFVSRGWLYLPESDPEAFDAFVHRYHVIALKPQYSSWGIGFRKLTEAEWDAAPDRQALFDELMRGKYLAEEFVQSDVRSRAFTRRRSTRCASSPSAAATALRSSARGCASATTVCTLTTPTAAASSARSTRPPASS